MTFGTKSAPCIATWCVVELNSSAPSFKSQSEILEDFYVDDLLSEGELDEDCFQMYEEVSNTFEVLACICESGVPVHRHCKISYLHLKVILIICYNSIK